MHVVASDWTYDWLGGADMKYARDAKRSSFAIGVGHDEATVRDPVFTSPIIEIVEGNYDLAIARPNKDVTRTWARVSSNEGETIFICDSAEPFLTLTTLFSNENVAVDSEAIPAQGGPALQRFLRVAEKC